MHIFQRYICLIILLLITNLLSKGLALAQKVGEAPVQSQYSFQHLTTADGLLNNEVTGMAFDNKGFLWIETQAGWNIWDGNKVRNVEAGMSVPPKARPSDKDIHKWSKIALPKSTSVVDNTILDVKDDGKGNIWIATDHQGVYIYNKVKKSFTNLVYSPSKSTSIAENHVSVIAVNHDGTVALGHIKKGVSIYKPMPFRLTHFQSSTWRNVSSVLEDHEGDLWIGTDGFGLFNVTKRKHIEIPGNIVVSLMEDKNGRIWVGTYKNGLLCLQNGVVAKHYTKQNSNLSDNNVYSLCQDKNGFIWIGALFGFLQAYLPDETKDGIEPSRNWHDFKSKNKSESIVMDFAYDGGDFLYAGTLWGISRININTGERTQIYGNKSGKRFFNEDVQSLHKDKRGLLWIGHARGLTVWSTRTDSLYYLTKEQGLCDDVIRSICEDNSGRIWIGTSNGLSIVTVLQKGNGIAFNFDNYTTDRGLLDNNFSRHSMIRLHDGNIILGSYEGYSLANLTGKPNDIETASPYEIGEEWSVWTSWQAIVIYIALVLAILVTYLIMRWNRRRAIVKAIKKAQEIWAKNPVQDTALVAVRPQKEKQETTVSKKTIEVAPSEIEITSRDEQLVKDAIQIVEKHISDDFTVEDLSKGIGLTRGHLYKKLTALTGKTPVEFIRTIRMKRACQLLDQSGMQVAEVAYAVGYSSPKIFSRNFKAEMGMTPTEYMGKVKK